MANRGLKEFMSQKELDRLMMNPNYGESRSAILSSDERIKEAHAEWNETMRIHDVLENVTEGKHVEASLEDFTNWLNDVDYRGGANYWAFIMLFGNRYVVDDYKEKYGVKDIHDYDYECTDEDMGTSSE